MSLAVNHKKVPDFVNELLPKLSLAEQKGQPVLNLSFGGQRVGWIKVDERLFNAAETDYHKDCIDRLMTGGEDTPPTRQTTAEELADTTEESDAVLPESGETQAEAETAAEAVAEEEGDANG